MRIKYAIAFNWGNLLRNHFPFEPGLNLILGPNGEGKSTLIDAIQSVMTADLTDIRNYNAGQSEDTTKRQSKVYRSFASYLLGADQHQFTREAALGVTALVFEEEEDGYVMTAFLLGSARVEGSGEDRRAAGGVDLCGICRGHAMVPEDFLSSGDSGEKMIMEPQELRRHLERKYGASATPFGTKKEYIVALYADFLGLPSITYSDAIRSAKAFVKYIHPTKSDDYHRFVKEELLDKKDQTKVVENLRSTLRSYNDIKREAEEITNSKEHLESAVSKGEKLMSTWMSYFDDKYMYNKRKEVRVNKRIVEYTREKQIFEVELQQLLGEIEKDKETQASLHAEKICLKEQVSSSDAVKQKEQLDQELRSAQSDLAVNVRGFESSISSFRSVSNHLKNLAGVVDVAMFPGGEAAAELSALLERQFGDDTDKASAFSRLFGPVSTILDPEGPYIAAVRNAEVDAHVALSDALKRKKEVSEELGDASRGAQSRYPNQKDIDLLNQALPGANAKPVCEYMDILSPEWQQAIEGYIGGNRFAIVVEENFEAEAAELLLRERASSKVVQGAKLLQDMRRSNNELKSSSIVTLMNFSHPVAKAFMYLNYGSVLQVSSTEELRFTSRGVTKAGLGSGSYTMFRCLAERRNCYIGERAKMERYAELAKEKEMLTDHITELSALKSSIGGNRLGLEKIELTDPAETVRDSQKLTARLEGLQRQIEALDLGDLKIAFERIKEIDKELPQLGSKIESDLTQKGRKEQNIADKKRAITHEEGLLASIRKDIENAATIIRAAYGTSSEQHLRELGETAERTFKDDKSFIPFAESVKDAFLSYRTAIDDHNRSAIAKAIADPLPEQISDEIDDYFAIHKLYQRHGEILSDLKNNILVKKRHVLAEKQTEFESIFKEEFAQRIINDIDSGKFALDETNRMLARHQFGSERFVIRHKMSAEFKNMYEYLKHLTHSIGVFAHTEELSEEFAEARAKIEALLSSTDDGKSQTELFRIADYRNYREYDIHKIINGDEEHSISLDKSNTASGGQATTSYYVIRSIAAYAAFGKDNRRKKRSGIGFLLIDEAFSRVDDQRPGMILDYLINDLGFQVISAMPPQNESVFADYATGRYEVSKEIVDPRYESYKVITHVEYSVQNINAVKELIDSDKRIITAQQMEMVFE